MTDAPLLPESDLPELRWCSASLEGVGAIVVIYSPEDDTIRAASLAQATGEEPEVAAIGRVLEKLMDQLEALAPATAAREMKPLPADRGRVAEAVAAYAAGSHAALDELPVVQPGSAYRQDVWAAMREIPAGETVSYAELAQMAGRPLAHRAAASACANNLVAFAVPCHRVIRADGGLGGYGFGGIETKRALLAREGLHLTR
ncbi:methylated-DNA--[protein]-cysteine S-methyltransferase [Nesterenkonia jeotgali]|uniref:methylated-DNA--[protein]-cysteine S-methyltransferase n=1 Tax=Nesterenkonia jeotgali TaxID=317018 RepID=A0A0W8IC54_9MICC|nr:methylated-DNA--[protein]-cysteine S-methyltransferase [Nesterenkonia jeotgali]KUG57526.1 6-O-methylguanine DNA methyltransferase [Nesterenkonia jeotgali]MBA8922352.1 O-6-methylguanine DNA methyltransferase [Nesterenkonia jeotgali]